MDNISQLGLERGLVRLTPYTPDWTHLFAQEKAQLQAAIGTYIVDIQHVGSTAIPNMPAKPILDIGVAVTNFETAVVCILPLEKLGYIYKGEHGIARRHYFVKGSPRTHHLHMNEINGPDWQSQILFRDYLCQHPQIAQAYATLKQSLARRFPTDRENYLQGKGPFIEKILHLAQAGSSQC